jgi:hypothetical protein
LAELRAELCWIDPPLPSRSRIAALFKYAKRTRCYSRHSELPSPQPTGDLQPHDEWELDAQGWMRVDGIGKVCLVNILDVVSRLKVESYPCIETTNPRLTIPPQGLTIPDLMGELTQLLALPSYQLALPFMQAAWRQFTYIDILAAMHS